MCSVVLLEYLHDELLHLVNLNLELAHALDKKLSRIDEQLSSVKTKMNMEMIAKDIVIDELQRTNAEHEENIKHLEDRIDALENFIIDITSTQDIHHKAFML